MSTVGADAVRKLVRDKLNADTTSGGLFNASSTYRVHGVFEEVGRDEGAWPRIIMRVSVSSLDGNNPVIFGTISLSVETDWDGNPEDRGLTLAHGISNRIRSVLEGHSATVADTAGTSWIFSPVQRVNGSQNASQRVLSRWASVTEAYAVVGTSGSTAIRVQGESSITATGITTSLGLNPEGWSITRSARLIDVTPVGVVGVSSPADFERKMAQGVRSYSGTYMGQNTGTTPSMPSSGGTVKYTIGGSDYYQTLDGVFGQVDVDVRMDAQDPIRVAGTVHFNPGTAGVTVNNA